MLVTRNTQIRRPRIFFYISMEKEGVENDRWHKLYLRLGCLLSSRQSSPDIGTYVLRRRSQAKVKQNPLEIFEMRMLRWKWEYR